MSRREVATARVRTASVYFGIPPLPQHLTGIIDICHHNSEFRLLFKNFIFKLLSVSVCKCDADVPGSACGGQSPALRS